MLPEIKLLLLNYPPATHPAATAGLLAAFLLYVIVKWVLYRLSAPTRELPGPKSVNWLTGSFTRESDSLKTQLEWIRQYGPVFKYYSWFNMTRVLTTDLQALNYVLNSTEFEKPSEARQFLGDILGRGLLFVEGSKHRQQRKIMNPAFGLTQIKEYSQLFVEKANELRDVLMTRSAQSLEPDGSLKIDAYLWLTKVTLDIIGHAGFNHSFQSLYHDGLDEVTIGLRQATKFDPFSIKFILSILFPPVRLIPNDRSRVLARTLKYLRSLGQGLISPKKAEILAATQGNAKGIVEKKNFEGRDLLSLLIRANMATDLPDSARMTDEEILAQVPTFLFAGHETTSTAVTWALYDLAHHPAACAKLKAETRAFYTDTPSMDELNGMTYLDYVTREVLRVHAPISFSTRVAKTDVVVPLSQLFTNRCGVKRHELRLRKGDRIFIPILAVQVLKSLWGEDAEEFRPERWESIPEAVKAMPSVFSNLLTFAAGSHACIGYRFSIIETKAILFSFVRSFDFELVAPPTEVKRSKLFVGYPFLRSDVQAEPQLPLVIRPAKSE